MNQTFLIKDSVDGFAVYMQKGLPFARKTLKIPVENSEYSFLRF